MDKPVSLVLLLLVTPACSSLTETDSREGLERPVVQTTTSTVTTVGSTLSDAEVDIEPNREPSSAVGSTLSEGDHEEVSECAPWTATSIEAALATTCVVSCESALMIADFATNPAMNDVFAFDEAYILVEVDGAVAEIGSLATIRSTRVSLLGWYGSRWVSHSWGLLDEPISDPPNVIYDVYWLDGSEGPFLSPGSSPISVASQFYWSDGCRSEAGGESESKPVPTTTEPSDSAAGAGLMFDTSLIENYVGLDGNAPALIEMRVHCSGVAGICLGDPVDRVVSQLGIEHERFVSGDDVARFWSFDGWSLWVWTNQWGISRIFATSDGAKITARDWLDGIIIGETLIGEWREGIGHSQPCKTFFHTVAMYSYWYQTGPEGTHIVEYGTRYDAADTERLDPGWFGPEIDSEVVTSVGIGYESPDDCLR